MSYRNRVTHRPIGTLVVGMRAGMQMHGPMKPAVSPFKPFDAEAYKASVDAFCRSIRDYIAHMKKVRAGLIENI